VLVSIGTSMPFRRKLERVLRFTLLAFVLGAAAFLSAITAIRIAIRGRVVDMPNLIGKPVAQAQQLLVGRHLRLRVADRIYSPLPENAVVRQSPPPGEQMKVSQDAHVVLSLGPQIVYVPELEGHSLRAARITLLESGLQLGELSTVILPGAQPDTVLQQDPAPGSTASSPRVDLLVAEPPPPASFVMPALVGLRQQDADRVVTEAGLRVTKRTYIAAAGAPAGTIIGQTPPRGARIDPGVSVELGIAR
jgi:eukaryotic-like serine/threonine-protein kinase